VPLVEKREPDAVRFDVHVLRCLAALLPDAALAMALDRCRLVVRVIVIVAVALADRQRVVARLAATPSMLTLRSASSAANRPRRFAQTPSNTRRASRSAAGRAAISQPT
jgi:hypothetical protein